MRPYDISGKRFGKLVAIKKTEEKKNGSLLWECRCDCGNTCKASVKELNAGWKKSCGCEKGFHRHLEGKRFGHLTVISDTGEKQKNVKLWLCRCDCGNMIKVRTDSLTGGKTISCGCQKKTQEKIKQLIKGRNIRDHTSDVFFKGTISKNNQTGVRGVAFYKGYYISTIGYKNKNYRLYYGKDFDYAVKVRKEAENHLFDDFEKWIKERRGGR